MHHSPRKASHGQDIVYYKCPRDFNKVLEMQYNESAKMKKLFNVSELPFDFQYAQDHLFGLAEAKELGDPKIAKQTLKNLVASTREQNRVFGQEGFSNKRVSLIKKFKND